MEISKKEMSCLFKEMKALKKTENNTIAITTEGPRPSYNVMTVTQHPWTPHTKEKEQEVFLLIIVFYQYNVTYDELKGFVWFKGDKMDQSDPFLSNPPRLYELKLVTRPVIGGLVSWPVTFHFYFIIFLF